MIRAFAGSSFDPFDEFDIFYEYRPPPDLEETAGVGPGAMTLLALFKAEEAAKIEEERKKATASLQYYREQRRAQNRGEQEKPR